MAIHYHCRHCGTKLGSVDKISIHSESLGLHKLTEQERNEMVTYGQDGDIHISSICEDCQEALERNPEYHQMDYLIQ
ncbi:anti-sigma-F factor Fin family protein [Neobacillus sp. SM06]|uniref:anti-sigma-F factor Fin family protein n=1 Tax=Neobacillus sp. SM06 TaxID=3422492 RepID=UPI003D2AECFC